MTLNDLRRLPYCDDIIIYDMDEIVELTPCNILWGCEAFNAIPVKGLGAMDNALAVYVDMPIGVLQAWKNYAEAWKPKGV